MCTLRVQNAAYRRPTNETQYYNRSFLFLLRHSVVKQILLDIDAILLCLQIFFYFIHANPSFLGISQKHFPRSSPASEGSHWSSPYIRLTGILATVFLGSDRVLSCSGRINNPENALKSATATNIIFFPNQGTSLRGTPSLMYFKCKSIERTNNAVELRKAKETADWIWV